MTICMMTMVHHTIFRHMKKMKTAIGSCSMGKQLSKKNLQNHVCIHDFAVELSLILSYAIPSKKAQRCNNSNMASKLRIYFSMIIS